MNRIQQPWAEDIAVALAQTAGFGFESLDFLCGTDPVYAGLHRFEDMTFGRSYRSSAHCSHRHQSSDARTTIVLPTPQHWTVVVHELGHALDERQGWRWTLPPVSEYAKVDRQEAFAEAFLTWVLGDGQPDSWAARYDVLARWEPDAGRIFAGLV